MKGDNVCEDVVSFIFCAVFQWVLHIAESLLTFAAIYPGRWENSFRFVAINDAFNVNNRLFSFFFLSVAVVGRWGDILKTNT